MQLGLKSLFIITLLLPILIACKSDKKQFIIGVSQCSQDEWRNKMNIEMQHESLLHPEAKLIIKSVSDDTEKQIQDIEQFISDSVDLLIVTPNKAAPLTPVIEKAFKAGIPVVLVDRKILSDNYTAFVGADNYEIGQEVGNYIVSVLKEKGNVAEIEGLDGSTSALERHQGFFSVISKYPNINLVYREDAAWLKDVGETKMTQALSKNIQIDVVYAQNDRMAKGAYHAAQQIGLEDKIKFIGIDGLAEPDEGIDMVLSGKLEATFLYPTGGDKAVQAAMNILQNRPFEKNTILHTALIDKSNAKIIKLQTSEITSLQKKMDSMNKQIDNYLDKYALQRNILYLICSVVVLTVLLLVWIFVSYRAKNRLNRELSKRNAEINNQNEILQQQKSQLIHLSEKLEEATHVKLVFFTNISHEFRTPLTLIAGPLETLLSDSEITPEQKRLLSLMRRNVNILLNLIDQIIEFRRIENGKHSLKIGKHNLVEYFLDWNMSFAEVAHKKGVEFKYENDYSDYLMDVDLEKMERIYLNLLSNAIKYTPKGGYIHIYLNKEQKDNIPHMHLRVANQGKALTEEQIHNIFERFYKVDSHVAGAGIGLALTKAFVDMHGGTITTESKDNEVLFSVYIPFYNQTEAGINTNNTTVLRPSFIGQDYFSDQSMRHTEMSENKIKILVVDDNQDVRNYLHTILSSHYDIVEAEDGEVGFYKAINQPIDIVVSDVIMPKIDGIALCQKLKEDPTTCHIPVILLTASSQDEERIKGFESGADAYIAKPFNPNMLVIRVRKILENRQKLVTHFNQHLTLSDVEPNIEILVNPMDEKLITKFNTHIYENITNSNLNVEDIGRELGFSRAQLYRKLKAITNQSPNELIRNIRLRFSQELLKQQRTITEIAYESGFTSVSYYSKCYKDHFKETPSDFQNRYLRN
ncbi:MAG: Sensor histidine kinase TmoS [Bacteroidota bacterium]